MAGLLVRVDVVFDPARESRIGGDIALENLGIARRIFIGRARELPRHRRHGFRRQQQVAFVGRGEIGLDRLAHLRDAEALHQDLDARLVHVVAAAKLVIDAQNRFEIGEQLHLGHEVA